MKDRLSAADGVAAGIVCRKDEHEEIKLKGRFDVTCVGPDGTVKWVDHVDNLVVTTGKNDLLDKYLAGSAYTAAFYLGLVDGTSTPTYAAADTMASHGGWTENTGYSQANRPTPTWNAASAGSKASQTVAFTINADDTIAGVFLTTNNTKGGTSGTLFSAGSFAASRAVQNGDTLNATYTLTV